MSKLGAEAREVAKPMMDGDLEPWKFALALHSIYPTEPKLLGELYQSSGAQAMMQEAPYVFGPPTSLRLHPIMEAVYPGFTDQLAGYLQEATQDTKLLKACAEGLQGICSPVERSAKFHTRLVGPIFKEHQLLLADTILQEAMLRGDKVPFPIDDKEALLRWLGDTYSNSPFRAEMAWKAQNGFGNTTWYVPPDQSTRKMPWALPITPILPEELMALRHHANQFNARNGRELPDALAHITYFGGVIAPPNERSTSFFAQKIGGDVNPTTVFEYCTGDTGYLARIKGANKRPIPSALTIFDAETAAHHTRVYESVRQ